MTEKGPRLDELLCFAVYAASHAFNRVYKPLLDDLGLTYPQYLVMVALWDEDGRTVGQIGKDLSLESSTLTPLLKRLEAAGFLSRERDARDERQVRICLTEAGRSLRAKALKVPACIAEATGLDVGALRRMTGEINALKTTLDRFDGPSVAQAAP